MSRNVKEAMMHGMPAYFPGYHRFSLSKKLKSMTGIAVWGMIK